MKVIAFTGLAGSGKSSLAREVALKLISRGKLVQVTSFSRPMKEYLQSLGTDKSTLFRESKQRIPVREFLQELADLTKNHFGADIFAKMMFEVTCASGLHDYLLIDDLRFLPEYKEVKRHGGVVFGLIPEVEPPIDEYVHNSEYYPHPVRIHQICDAAIPWMSLEERVKIVLQTLESQC